MELLSPLKMSKSGYDYYNGQVNDGTKALRLVGFDGDSRDKLAEFVDNKTPVKATHCTVKKSRMTDELEIHIGKATTLVPSARRLTFDCTEKSLDVYTSIQQLLSLDDSVRVNIKGKVVKVAPARTVSTGIVQEVTLEDESGTIDLSLWNNNVDTVSEGDVYDFKNLTVNTFRNNKVLNFTNHSSSIKLEKESIDTSSSHHDIAPATIQATLIGIQGFEIHVWCQYCDTNRILRHHCSMPQMSLASADRFV